MSIDQANAIDFVGVDNETGKFVLTISDHRDWTHVAEHVLALQDKINTYIAFIETGQIKEHPDSNGREIAIAIYAAFVPCSDAMVTGFFATARQVLATIGVELCVRVIPDA